MRILVIGGTRFMGPHIIRNLCAAGHKVSVFHRGHTRAELPLGLKEILGNRDRLPEYTSDFQRLSPEIIVEARTACARPNGDLHRHSQACRRCQQHRSDSEPAKTALLRRVPLGSNSETAAAALSKEGLECNTISRPSDENTRTSRGLENVEMNGARLNCQLLTPAGVGYTLWIIDLWFDEGHRLPGVKVAIWNIFL